MKDRAIEKQELSDEINKFLQQLVYEGTIRSWNAIDLKFLRVKDLRRLKRELEEVI